MTLPGTRYLFRRSRKGRSEKVAGTFLFVFLLAGCCNPFRGSHLSLDPDTLPDAVVGVPYKASVKILHADTPVGAVNSKDPLPPGLDLFWTKGLHSRTFAISGTPTAAGTFKFRLGGYSYGTMCAGKSFDHEFVLRVAPSSR